MDNFVKQLKNQILDEFNRQDRRGVYAFTQKIMAYNSNKIEGSPSQASKPLCCLILEP